MVFHYYGDILLPGNEFYRFIDIYFIVGSQKRDEDLGAFSDRVCPHRYCFTGYW
jgi:hypothetical protein